MRKIIARLGLTLGGLVLVVSAAHAAIYAYHPTGCITRICFAYAAPGGLTQKCFDIDMTGLFNCGG